MPASVPAPLPATERYARELEVALAAVRRAGELLRDDLHRPDGPRGRGGHADADAEAELVLRDALDAAFGDHGVIGEELGARDRAPSDAAGHVWILDPNDGTSCFTRGLRGSAVSVALVRGGAPVLGIVFAFAAPDDDGDLFYWAEGMDAIVRNRRAVRPDWREALDRSSVVLQSRSAERAWRQNAAFSDPARFRGVPSVAYRLALAAAGDGDAACSFQYLAAWDVAGGHALLRGAGGTLLAPGGEPVRYDDRGHIRAAPCFGGAPAITRAISKRPWRGVIAAADATTDAPASPFPSPPFDPRRPDRSPLWRGPELARAQGCLLGQLAGDSLGSLVEFQSASQIASRYPRGVRELADGGTWGTLAGQPTDDSELALCLARTLLDRGAFEPEAVARAYAWWMESRPFDVGNTIRQACSAAARAVARDEGAASAARAAANRESQANGALMRLAPLAVFGHAAPPATLAAWAGEDAGLTHPHPVCRDANAVMAVAIARAISTGERGQDVVAWAERWARDASLSTDVLETLASAAEGPPADFLRHQGWVRIALQNAFSLARREVPLEDALVETVGRGGDTDTNAAIAGALLGATQGREAVPARWRRALLSCHPGHGLAGVRRPRPRALWPTDALDLAERLLATGHRQLERQPLT